MVAKNTSVLLTDELQSFVREQVEAGAYRSTSEVVRDALERLANEKRKEAALLASLDAGIASGRVAPGVFARVRKKRAPRR
jgi:antitoxin ParD1/3/4